MSKTILNVDDSASVRQMVQLTLQGAGYRVLQANDGADGLAKAKANPVDMIVTDLNMPVMNGLDAARRIRALGVEAGGERFASLPIIAMTALAMNHDVENSLAAGMNDHVTKPIDPELLMAVLVKWMRPHGDAGNAPLAGEKTGDDPLPELASIDVREGVRRIGGKVDAYLRQLRRFRENHADATCKLREQVERNDLSGAEETCHILKGVTGNLGAVALFDKVVAIYTALKGGEAPAPEDLDHLHALLVDVMQDIDRLAWRMEPAVRSVGAPLSVRQLHDRLENLRLVLDYDLGLAEPLLAELRAGGGATTWRGDIAALAAREDVFDIDGARAVLQKLQEKLKQAKEESF